MPTARVTIESIAAGGDGVGRADGLVVFVPRSAPGDEGDVELVPRGRFVRAEFTSLHAPSPMRADPPCAHYTRDRCGGCQLQHIRYEGQLEAKARIVRDAMQRIAHRDVTLPEVRASPDQWRYRRKLTLALRRRSGRWIAGLHPFDSPRQVFELHDCPITDERAMGVWREVLTAADDLPHVAELRGAVRQDDEGASLLLEGGRSWPRSSAFFARVPSLVALWWEPEQRSRVLLHRRGPESAPGASFAQVNAGVAALLQRDVVERVRSRSPASAVDGYAGLGDTAVALAEAGVAVTAIELDGEAAAWCARRLPADSRSIAGRVEDVLSEVLPSDVVLLNPPRAGVHERVTEILQQVDAPPRSVIYVSCNPATLARDVARMPRYRVAALRAFDMFPQTAHVETVCELVPEGA